MVIGWKCLPTAFILVAITVAPALAQDRNANIRDCNVEASKWSNMSWQSAQIATYRTCMANHNQPP